MVQLHSGNISEGSQTDGSQCDDQVLQSGIVCQAGKHIAASALRIHHPPSYEIHLRHFVTSQVEDQNSLSSSMQTPRISMTRLRSPWMTSKPDVRSQVRATSRLQLTAPTSEASRGAVRTTSATSNSFTGRGASLLEPRVFRAPAPSLLHQAPMHWS